MTRRFDPPNRGIAAVTQSTEHRTDAQSQGWKTVLFLRFCVARLLLHCGRPGVVSMVVPDRELQIVAQGKVACTWAETSVLRWPQVVFLSLAAFMLSYRMLHSRACSYGCTCSTSSRMQSVASLSSGRNRAKLPGSRVRSGAPLQAVLSAVSGVCILSCPAHCAMTCDVAAGTWIPGVLVQNFSLRLEAESPPCPASSQSCAREKLLTQHGRKAWLRARA